MTRIKILFFSVALLLVFTVSGAMASSPHTGKVLEIINGGGYTYMNIEENDTTFWIAGPQTMLRVGTTVSFYEQIWMNNFESKALGRTFERLLFVGGVEILASPSSSASTAKKASFGTPAKVAGAFTVEELHIKAKELSGQEITVSGNVVKVSANIMGNNWVHIQDGSGSAAEGTNNMVFRSKSDTAAVGDHVTATGRLETDKDFGYGYFYPVIIEDSNFIK